MGLAQMALERLNAAQNNLKKAYEMSLEASSPSSAAICQAILDCRKKQFEVNERKHQERAAPLLSEIRDLYDAKLSRSKEQANKTLEGEELKDELAYIQSEHDQRINDILKVFQDSGQYKNSNRETEAPDYLLDPISFNLFVDPVITKSGNSFERSWILQHLKTSSTDPFSREPLRKEDLRPNIQLKAAAQDFLEKHGVY